MSAFPALAGLLVPGGEAAGGPESFPPDIEEEANNYFQVHSETGAGTQYCSESYDKLHVCHHCGVGCSFHMHIDAQGAGRSMSAGKCRGWSLRTSPAHRCVSTHAAPISSLAKSCVIRAT